MEFMEQLMSLSKMFSEKLYRIPDYQRGYAWTKKEAEDLWNDLNRLNIEKKHYIGVVTLEKVKEEDFKKWHDDLWIIQSKNYQPYYIVDGQQRLTTLIMLIQCIIEKMQKESISSLNYTRLDQIIDKYIYQSKTENCSKSYLFSYESGNPCLNFWTQEILDNKNDTTNTRNMTMYTANLRRVKEFFQEKLSNLNIEELEKVYSKITQSFLFNTYEISEDIDVFVAFESMNNRGKRLSILELLKNRLIYLSTLFNVGNDIKARLRDSINLCWKTIYAQLGMNPDNPLNDDEFLRAHYMLYFYDVFSEGRKGVVREENYEKLRPNYLLEKEFIPEKIDNNSLKTNDIFDYINSLSDVVKIWSEIRNPFYSRWNDEIKLLINKINFFLPSYPIFFVGNSPRNIIILKVLQTEKDQSKIKRFLKAIERFSFINLFYNRSIFDDSIGNFDEDDLLNKILKEHTPTESIAEKYEKECDEIINSEQMYAKLIKTYSKTTFYENKEITRYILSDYEIKLMNESKSIKKVNNILLGDKNYSSIEHIYPKKATDNYWIDKFKKYTAKQQSKLRNSIGNLLLVSELRNTKLANKPFPEKKENNKNVVGYKYGSYNEIEICKNDDWGAEQILNRGIKILIFIQERWGIKIKKSDYLKILGLDFMKNKK